MRPIGLKSKVRIIATGVLGVVNGIWESVGAEDQFNVTYYDTTSRRADNWFRADEIEKVE